MAILLSAFEKKLANDVKTEILRIHEKAIRSTAHLEAGKKVEVGVRDEGSLDFLSYRIAKIYTGIFTRNRDDKDLLFYDFAKILKEMSQKYHIFVDGNKRTSYLVTKVFLLSFGYHLKISYYEDALPFLLSVASGKNPEAEIKEWLLEHTIRIPKDAHHSSNAVSGTNDWFDKYLEKWLQELGS